MSTQEKKAPKNNWENFWKDRTDRPDLSTGTPEDLTPNQIAERAASELAHRAISDNDIRQENGWRLLARHVGLTIRKEIDEYDCMPPELLNRWVAGWYVGYYNLKTSCPDCSSDEQRLWKAGIEDGVKARLKMQYEESNRRKVETKPTEQVAA